MKAMHVFLALSMAACGGPQRDADTLKESILAYNEGVRWERFETAASSLPPKLRSEFVDEMDTRAKDLKISQYDIVRVDKPTKKMAKVHVKTAWYKDSEGTLKETHAVQTWERHGKAWWMVEEKRLRGAEMPGLMEPADKAEPPESGSIPPEATLP
ncbi:MAG: hypothetical protein H0T46_35770 [Deltaproteobacteria bacterium]|nr:hypothetical protein [Deltaproteobacteria bacterium]